MSVNENYYDVFIIFSEVGCNRNSLVQLLGTEVICEYLKHDVKVWLQITTCSHASCVSFVEHNLK
jgi:hypothetical protein